MLTPNQEAYCRYREIEKLSQRKAYCKAYPGSRKWKPESVDSKASALESEDKVQERLKELRYEEKEKISKEAAWRREDAFRTLTRLIEAAQEQIEASKGITSSAASAIIGAVKELNAIYAVEAEARGDGALGDILAAVRGLGND